MAWTVEWTVTGGHSGARPDRSPTRIYQGDTVRFVLSLINDYEHALELAATRRGWRDLPKLVVTGYQNTRTVTHADADNPLVIDYTFNYQGRKHLNFQAIAARFVDPTQRVPRRGADGELQREAMFPNLELARELHVQPSTSRGEATASTAGAQSSSARRQQSEMDRRRQLADRLRRRQDEDRQEALEVLDSQAQARREAALPQRGRLSSRGVLLGINLLEAHQISTGTIEQAQAYLARLQSAIRVTTALDLYNRPWEDVPNQGYVARTRFRQQRIAWQVDAGYRIRKVRQYRYKFGASTANGFDQRPPLHTNETIETIRLQASDWLVVRFGRGGAKSLIPARAAIDSIHREQLGELADLMITLGSLAMAAATSPAALAFEVLANTLIPEEVNEVIGVASISVSVVRGLARMLARVIRNTRTLRAANTALLRALAGLTGSRGRGPRPTNPRGTGNVINNAQRGLSPRTGRTLPGIGPVRLNPRTGDTLHGIGPMPRGPRTGDTLPGVGSGPRGPRSGDTLSGTGPNPPGPNTGNTLPGIGPDPNSLPHARTLPGARSGQTHPGAGPGSSDPGHARTMPGPRSGQTNPMGSGADPDDIGHARTLPDTRSGGRGVAGSRGVAGGRPAEPPPNPADRIVQVGHGDTVLEEMTAEEIALERRRRWNRLQRTRYGGPTEGVIYQDYWESFGGEGTAPRHGFRVTAEDHTKVIFNNSLMPSGTPGLHAPFTGRANW